MLAGTNAPVGKSAGLVIAAARDQAPSIIFPTAPVAPIGLKEQLKRHVRVARVAGEHRGRSRKAGPARSLPKQRKSEPGRDQKKNDSNRNPEIHLVLLAILLPRL
jgi:hypothetical protein